MNNCLLLSALLLTVPASDLRQVAPSGQGAFAAEIMVLRPGSLLRCRVRGTAVERQSVALPIPSGDTPCGCTSSDGRYIALSLGGKPTGQALYVYDFKKPRWSLIDRGECLGMQFSRDGRYVSYFRSSPGTAGLLWVRQTNGRGAAQVVARQVSAVQWGRPADRLVYSDAAKQSWSYSADSGRIRWMSVGEVDGVVGRAFRQALAAGLTSSPAPYCSVPDVSPNGSSAFLGYASGGPKPMSTDDGRPFTESYFAGPAIYEFVYREKRLRWRPRGNLAYSAGSLVAWSPEGRRALFSFEDRGFAVLDLRVGKAIYSKFDATKLGRLVGGSVSN